LAQNPTGLTLRGSIYQATPERAVVDLLYFNPHAHLDAPKLCDWRRVRAIQRALGLTTARRASYADRQT
jgi:hypothetical protein